MKLIGILAVALIAAPSIAHAGGCEGKNEAADVVLHIFDHADLDQDGFLSPGEYEEAGLESFGVSFEESDLNADGETSTEEYRELYEIHHAGHDEKEV